MRIQIREWRPLLVGLMPVALILAACVITPGVSNQVAGAALKEHPFNVIRQYGEGATSSDEPVGYLTINVDMTDDGIQPRSIFIPAGRRVKLVMRNRGNGEHHYKVLGLVPKDPMWLARAENIVSLDDDEHAHHGEVSFVNASLMPFNKCTSTAGVCPAANEVHAYSEGGGLDAVFLTATTKGTFKVECPLHPEITGRVTVY